MSSTSLNELAAFAAIARSGNFTRAAASLGVSPSALSHAMRTLETRVGVRLLARTTRSVAATPAGQQLLSSIEPALLSIEEGLTALDRWRDDPAGIIRITTIRYIARHVLEPRLTLFLREHPRIVIELDVDDRAVDIVAAGFDVGFRFGDHLDKDLIAMRAGVDVPMIVVGSPAYFAAHGRPDHPEQLMEHACVNYRVRTRGDLFTWRFRRGSEELAIRPPGPLIVNQGDTALAVICGGRALGYMLAGDVQDEIASGTLIPVLTDWSYTMVGPHLYHAGRRQMPAAVRVFVDAFSQSSEPHAALEAPIQAKPTGSPSRR